MEIEGMEWERREEWRQPRLGGCWFQLSIQEFEAHAILLEDRRWVSHLVDRIAPKTRARKGIRRSNWNGPINGFFPLEREERRRREEQHLSLNPNKGRAPKQTLSRAVSIMQIDFDEPVARRSQLLTKLVFHRRDGGETIGKGKNTRTR